jgi:hypothetical protein
MASGGFGAKAAIGGGDPGTRSGSLSKLLPPDRPLRDAGGDRLSAQRSHLSGRARRGNASDLFTVDANILAICLNIKKKYQ